MSPSGLVARAERSTLCHSLLPACLTASCLQAKHGGTLDWGAIHLAVRDAAGLPPNSKDKSE